MAERFIEIQVPAGRAAELRDLVARHEAVESWQEPGEDVKVFKLFVPAEQVESVLDPVQAAFGGSEEFRAVVLSVEATLPKRAVAEAGEGDVSAPEPAASQAPERVSREELYEDVSGYARITRVYLCMVVLSTIVAVIGISRNSPAILIGAMVIAPLLGPNVALSLATTLGDAGLARRAIRATASGLLLAVLVALLAGLVVPLEAASAEVVSRTEIGLGDLILALAAGAAGALAFTSGVSSTLVGVMVAVALLPPLVVFAMLLTGGHGHQSVGALLLLISNIVCINLAGVATFLVQGVSPRTWWETERSKRMSRRALGVWVALLVVLAGLICLSRFSGS
ncbi:MAG TPA: TIGR00341 family protein [Phycisphaerae bacterium]|nr:TIGR00341 family protein [Phycisphaerae bacterium]